MKKILNIVLLVTIIGTSACKLIAERPKPKPDWVYNRPINTLYYIGIGVASKNGTPEIYQQTAKKNALNDLISEIKVTVSANSILSQYQNDNNFRQQFESETKVSALNTIENYEVVGSWENKENYWIYYRLSKAEYEELKNRKRNLAISRAEDFLERSESLNQPESLMQSIRLKVKALTVIQDYLSEDLETVFKGKTTYLSNEILHSLQNQLYLISLNNNKSTLLETKEKLVSEPIYAWGNLKTFTDSTHLIPYMPLRIYANTSQNQNYMQVETDQFGKAFIDLNGVAIKNRTQSLQISLDIDQITNKDSVNSILKQILSTIDLPSTSIRFVNKPMPIYFMATELNLGNNTNKHQIESLIKNKLIDDGYIFSSSKEDASLTIELNANTKSLGAIYKTTYAASIDLTLSVIDTKTKNEIYRVALTDIKGYQNNAENAGIEAYNTAQEKISNQIYPKLLESLNSK